MTSESSTSHTCSLLDRIAGSRRWLGELALVMPAGLGTGLWAWHVDDKAALARPWAEAVADGGGLALLGSLLGYAAVFAALFFFGEWLRTRKEGDAAPAERWTWRCAFVPHLLLWPLALAATRLGTDEAARTFARLIWVGAVGLPIATAGAFFLARVSWRPAWKRFLMALGLACLVYVITFTILSFMRHDNFHSNMHDLGLYDQIMWTTLHGDFFRCTQWQIEGQYHLDRFGYNFLAEHFMLILLALTPLYAIWPDPRALLLTQSVALGGAGLVLGIAARRALLSDAAESDLSPERGERTVVWLAFALGLSFILHPLTQQTNVKEFHADALEPLFIFLAAWALFARRPFVYGLGLLLAMACKEDVSMSVAALGVYLLVFTRRRLWGVMTLLAGAAWYIGVIKLAMPLAFRDGEPIRHLTRYAWLVPAKVGAASMGDVIKTLALNPIFAIARSADAARASALLLIFLPVAFLPFRRLPVFIILAPTVAANLFSGWPIQHSLDLHYGIAILPWVYFATLLALTPDLSSGQTRDLDSASGSERPFLAMAHGRFVAAAAIMIFSALLTVHLGRSPIGERHSWKRYQRQDKHEAFEEALSRIPASAAISANSNLGAHLTRRRDIYQAPTLENAEYVVMDVSDSANVFPFQNDGGRSAQEAYFAWIERLREDEAWDVVGEWENACVLFRRNDAVERDDIGY